MTPTDDDRQDLLLDSRFGDLAAIQDFVTAFSTGALLDVHDDHGNTVLHMAAANGHTEVLAYLVACAPSLLARPNVFGSTPLHWAAVNRQLGAAQVLVRAAEGPGPGLIDIKNYAGRTPLGEAEMAGWDEGAQWFVEVMRLDEAKGAEVDASHAIEDADDQMTIDPSTRQTS